MKRKKLFDVTYQSKDSDGRPFIRVASIMAINEDAAMDEFKRIMQSPAAYSAIESNHTN